MATILSIAELKSWTNITATDAVIESKKLVETVETRLPIILNNYFTSDDIQLESTARFNATARSITIDTSENWVDYGFLAGDYIYIYNSYRNDKYVEISSLTSNVMVLTSAYSVIDEYFNSNDGKMILFSMVSWPQDVKMVAAEMCYYDYEMRSTIGVGKMSPGIKSRSLGPLSETYSGETGQFGYPIELLSKLDAYRLARFM